MNSLAAGGAALLLAVASSAGQQKASSGRFEGMKLHQVCDTSRYKCRQPTMELPVVSVSDRKDRVESIPFFVTSEPVEWIECQRASVAEICLRLGSGDIEKLNAMYVQGTRRLFAFVVGGKIISLVSIRGEWRRSIDIGPADDALPLEDLASFLSRH